MDILKRITQSMLGMNKPKILIVEDGKLQNLAFNGLMVRVDYLVGEAEK